MKVPEILYKAQRQHKHNDGSDELIPAFDFEETIKVVNELEAKLEQLQNTSSNSDYATALNVIEEYKHFTPENVRSCLGVECFSKQRLNASHFAYSQNVV